MNTSRGFFSPVVIIMILGLVALGVAGWQKFQHDSTVNRSLELAKPVSYGPSTSVSVSTESGSAPLTVVFSAQNLDASSTLDFGDGKEVSCNGEKCPTFPLKHTYTLPGTYTVTLGSPQYILEPMTVSIITVR